MMSMSHKVESHQAVVSDLKRQIRGPLLQAGNPEFDEARSVWNEHRPGKRGVSRAH